MIRVSEREQRILKIILKSVVVEKSYSTRRNTYTLK